VADLLWHHEEPDLGPTAALRSEEDVLLLTVEGFNGDGTTPLSIDAAVQLRNALTDWLYKRTGHGWLERDDRG
jgi:hypothetical protein